MFVCAYDLIHRLLSFFLTSFMSNARKCINSLIRGIFMKKRRLVQISFFTLIGLLGLVFGVVNGAEARNLSFTLDTPHYRNEEALNIADQLRNLGIYVEVRAWDRSALNAKIKKGDRVAYLTDWGSSFFDPFDLALPKLITGGRGNFSFYSNPRVDQHLKAGSSGGSLAARKNAYFKVQEIIAKQMPWVFGYIRPRFEAISKDVLNFKPALDERINLHDVGLKKGDTLVVGIDAERFHTLDPAMHRSRKLETLIRNMFDGLVTRTPVGKVVPQLAESWHQVNDLEYIFKLRAGTQFHNGHPVTAQDVVFTFKQILNPFAMDGHSSPRKSLLGPLSRVEAIGTKKIRFVFKKPFPAFLQALVHFQIVPKNYIRQIGHEAFTRIPIGTGPFRFVKRSQGEEVVMERFDRYYGGSPEQPPIGLAKVAKAVFRAIPTAARRVDALIMGQTHIIQNVPLDVKDQLVNIGSFEVFEIEGTRAYQIELNNKITPFNDIRVRKALNYAIDWESILTKVYKGYGQRLATCFFPSGFGYTPLSPVIHDPQKAKILLEEAGYSVVE